MFRDAEQKRPVAFLDKLCNVCSNFFSLCHYYDKF